ncbi:Gti1/Pac2 family-domain-containing protein [Mycena amicta]|nr:Gti1/Pac2 family-domain-containing protein [Mycena amicta]
MNFLTTPWQDDRTSSAGPTREFGSPTNTSWTGQAPHHTLPHASASHDTRRRNITHQSLRIVIPPQKQFHGAHAWTDIRNVSDALVILEAVRCRLLPLTMRLSGSERDELCSGNVFVWEESTEEGGLVRWTDGRRWSQSRVVGDCLFYQEKIELTEEEKEAKAQRRVQRILAPGATVPPPPRNKRPSKSGGLTKQTYSFHVAPAAAGAPRKWHLVAYSQASPLSHSSSFELPVIEDYPTLRDVQVPTGVFTTSKRSDSPANVNPPPPLYRERQLHWEAHWADRESRSLSIAGSPRSASSYGTAGDDPTREDIILAPIRSQSLPLPRTSAWSTAPSMEPHPPDVVSQEGRRVLDRLRIRM